MKTTQTVMGMPITVTTAGDTEELTRLVFDWFRHVDATFSTYKPNSPVSRFGRGEMAESKLPAEVREVLAACSRWKTKTDGYFDAYHEGTFDPSGYVKGWSIERAAAMLHTGGCDNFCVEAGGDMQLAGHNEADAPWRVGIRNPFAEAEIVKTIELSDGAMATSGSYVRGAHIYDPVGGGRPSYWASVSVVGSSIIVADVLATAIFARGKEGLQMAVREGYECYAIDHTGIATMTPSLHG